MKLMKIFLIVSLTVLVGNSMLNILANDNTEDRQYVIHFDLNNEVCERTQKPFQVSYDALDKVKIDFLPESQQRGIVGLGWTTTPQKIVKQADIIPECFSNTQIHKDTKLYALWAEDKNLDYIADCKQIANISYQAEDAYVQPKSEVQLMDVVAEPLEHSFVATISDIVPKKEGATFVGWEYTKVDPSTNEVSTILLQPGETMKTTHNINLTLVAKWTDTNTSEQEDQPFIVDTPDDHPHTGVVAHIVWHGLFLLSILIISIAMLNKRKI